MSNKPCFNKRTSLIKRKVNAITRIVPKVNMKKRSASEISNKEQKKSQNQVKVPWKRVKIPSDITWDNEGFFTLEVLDPSEFKGNLLEEISHVPKYESLYKDECPQSFYDSGEENFSKVDEKNKKRLENTLELYSKQQKVKEIEFHQELKNDDTSPLNEEKLAESINPEVHIENGVTEKKAGTRVIQINPKLIGNENFKVKKSDFSSINPKIRSKKDNYDYNKSGTSEDACKNNSNNSQIETMKIENSKYDKKISMPPPIEEYDVSDDQNNDSDVSDDQNNDSDVSDDQNNENDVNDDQNNDSDDQNTENYKSIVNEGNLKTNSDSTKVQRHKSLFVSDDELDPVPGMEAWLNLYSFHKSLLRALKEGGFEKPTNIQSETIPCSLVSRADIIGSSETGSGKTLAFVLPIVQQIMEIYESCYKKEIEFPKQVYALIFAPSRELVVQIKEHIEQVIKYTPIGVMSIIGGLALPKQVRLLKNLPSIMVATPGRFWDNYSSGVFSESGIDFGQLRFLVFDEADKMVEIGRFRYFTDILRSLYSARKQAELRDKSLKPCQTFVFSATISIKSTIRLNLRKKLKRDEVLIKAIKNGIELTPAELMQNLIDQLEFQRNVKMIDVNTVDLKPQSLKEAKVYLLDNEKDFYLYYILKRYPGRTLVFVNSIAMIRRLVPILMLMRVPTWAMHSTMSQKQRLKNIERFRQNSNSVLISTDVLSRGLDIPKIETVIHYQVASSAEIYIHRCGRTARVHNPGLSISLIDPSEKINFESILKNLQRKDVSDFPIDMAYFLTTKKHVLLAQKLDALKHKKEKNVFDKNWVKKVAKDLEVDFIDDLTDNDELNVKETSFHNKRIQNEINECKAQLNEFLSKPLIPKGFSSKYITKDPEFMPILNANINLLESPRSESALDVIKTNGNDTSTKKLKEMHYDLMRKRNKILKKKEIIKHKNSKKEKKQKK